MGCGIVFVSHGELTKNSVYNMTKYDKTRNYNGS